MKKKSSKNVENFSIFEKNLKNENFENLEKSRKYFRTFSIENHIEKQKIENFEILDFRFPIRFSMEILQKYFRDFRDFQNFRIFFDFGFLSKIKKFSTDFDDFF